MRTITLEEHFATPAFIRGPGRELEARRRSSGRDIAQIAEKLLDLGEGRIAAMDAAQIDVQVLSLNSPGVEQLEPGEAVAQAHAANDALAEAIRRHPDRFAGFAALPTPDPQAAATELERTVRDYEFKGAVVNGRIGERYLDDPFFAPMLERAAALQAPLYLHPTPPPITVTEAYYRGNFSPEVAKAFSTHAWGWHIETAVHVLRIVLSGAFDRYPGLQLIVGHLGEALPFMLPRIDQSLPPEMTGLLQPVGTYLRENVSYTISGFNYLPPFLDLLFQVGVGRILFSADYPYQPMDKARDFLEHLPVSPADREKIAHENAEKLLKM